MFSSTLPDGSTLSSSAQTPKQIETVFQALVAQALGFDTTNDPDTAFFAVRCAWQTEGQPAWKVDENVCVVHARRHDDPFTKVNDQLSALVGSPPTPTEQIGYTQVWRVHFTVYGPNAGEWAPFIASAMALQWMKDALAAVNLYPVASWNRPVRVPELFERLWYEREDLELDFNEKVDLTLTPIASAAEIEITAVKENGLQDTVAVAKPL